VSNSCGDSKTIAAPLGKTQGVLPADLGEAQIFSTLIPLRREMNLYSLIAQKIEACFSTDAGESVLGRSMARWPKGKCP